MKKRILVIMLAVLCVTLMLALTSCGGNKDDGGDDAPTECTNHQYGEWTTLTNKTCTTAGSEKRVCSSCAKEETREIPASHNWGEWSVVTAATCEVDGEQARKCNDCDTPETEVIAAAGHQKQITTEAKEPTETESGVTEGAKCANCDYVYSESVELSKLGNLIESEKITVTEGEEWWGFTDTKQYIIDGKSDTAPRSPKGSAYELTITLKDDAFIKEIIVVCNGSGKVYDIWSSEDISNTQYNVKRVAITCYKDGEIVDVQNFEDTTSLTEVKLENVEKYVDTIEIYVESAIQNNGGAVIWEINAYGTAPLTECDKTGTHTFGDWEITKAPVCTDADTFEDGVTTRICSTCGKEETETIKAEHSWTEWGKDIAGDIFEKQPSCDATGYIGRMCVNCAKEEIEDLGKIDHTWGAWDVVGDCDNGATRTRICSVCETPETETTEPGEHANIVYDGYKAPTKTEDGTTGVKKCLACGAKLDDAKVLRIVNVALGGTVTTSTEYWALSGAYLQQIIDGNRETGICSSPKVLSNTETITFSEASNVLEVVLVVNGKGKTTEGGNYSEVTNNSYTISFMLFDESGELVYRSEQYSTLDKTEIVVNVELPEGATAKSISITRFKEETYIHEKYLWEVEVFAEKVLSACEVAGAHTWGGWITETEASCSQEGLTNGKKVNTCTVCGATQEEIIEASHSFGAWDESKIACLTGGTKTRECETCGYVESQTVEVGGHIETELQGAKEPTFEAEGSTGALVCTKCGDTVEEAKVISKLVNHASSATPTVEAWVLIPSYINDGDMNTGVTGYISKPNSTIHILTWSSPVGIDVIKLYFNGDTTGKALGSNVDTELPDRYENTNVGVDLTLKIYGADGSLIKTETVNTLDKTEGTITFEEEIQVSKIEIVNVHSWSSTLCVNIWEVQAISGGKIVTTEE